MFSYIILFLIVLLFNSCKDDATDAVETGTGELYTLKHGGYRTRLASDEWDIMKYGFDAVASSGDAYVSLEVNNKSNSFLLLGAPPEPKSPGIDAYRVVAGNTVTLNRSDKFTIDDPSSSDPNQIITAVRYTATSGMSQGSETLKIERHLQSMQDGTWHWIDLVTLKDEDEKLWGFTPGFFDNPLTLDAKIYNKISLPEISITRLYGSTVDLTSSKEFFNKILSQAVCDIIDIKKKDDLPYAAKPWDLNGNGKLDIWANEPQNTGDELQEFQDWAGINNLFVTNKIYAVVLDKEFEIHNNAGMPIYGLALENFIILPKLPQDIDFNRTFCHEYLHCNAIDSKEGLIDNTDEYNLMHYTSDYGKKWLRYRPVALELGGTQKQWDILSQQNI